MFLFKAGGAIERNVFPRRNSVGEELWASQLSQARVNVVKRFLIANSSLLSGSDNLS